MMEIRKILIELKYDLHDKNLKWGAKASDYAKELAKTATKIPVLIELDLDIELPKNIVIIDHHNEKAGKGQLTSIEQIAELLEIKLSRWQRLIAANDRGWIPAMEQAGATQQEIDKVRGYDRACQGVTAEMEEQAEKICGRIETTHDPVVVNFAFDIVSPITDRLYGKAENILILGPNSTTFSGDGRIVHRLAEKYPKSFFGGELPKRGFWGVPHREEKVEQLILNFWEEINDKKGFSEI